MQGNSNLSVVYLLINIYIPSCYIIGKLYIKEEINGKINNETEDPTTPNRITPARTLRTQRSRGQASTPKKSLKEGQKTD